ncbi:MAG TPA: hypothetical protein VJL29_01370 [Thermoguttaceae bacterium]|nr:hypothetical protein [Thermoguttaceae bacterium]
MFPLHDRVRRRVCVAGFLILCVLPTIAVLAWAAVWSLPAHVRAEARRIGRQLGMDVSVGRVEHLRPGAVRLADVRVREFEQPEALLHCETLDAEWITVADRSDVPRRVLMLRAGRIEVDANRTVAMGKLARRLLEMRAGNFDFDVRCLAERIDVRSSGPTEQLAEVCGVVQTIESGTETWMKFKLAGHPMTRPALLLLKRNRHVEPPVDWFALNTAGEELPCELLGRGIPAMRSLGPNARFRGGLSAEWTTDGWHGEIGSADGESPTEFIDVELNRLVTDRFPHVLSGKARVRIESAVFRGDCLERIRGGVVAGPGTIGSSLLTSVVQHLGLEPGPEPAARRELVDYDRLAFQFALDESGLVLDGSCHDDSKTVMVAGQKWLLRSAGRTCPAVSLAWAMAPKDSIPVPATRQSAALLRHLPLPMEDPAGAMHGNHRVATQPENSRAVEP